MTLRNDRELANTKRKLDDLQHLIDQASQNPSHGQSVEIRSFTRLANQLREEIMRYESTTSPQQARSASSS